MSSRRQLLSQIPLLNAVRGLAFEPRASSRSLEDRLQTAFDNLEIADTHEHFHDERNRLAMHMVQDPEASDGDRWRAFEPYWQLVRFAGASQALRHAVRDLYGYEPSASTIQQINDNIRATTNLGYTAPLCASGRASNSAWLTIIGSWYLKKSAKRTPSVTSKLSCDRSAPFPRNCAPNARRISRQRACKQGLSVWG